MGLPPIIDAEFSVVGELKPSRLQRFGRWCLYVLAQTVIAGIVAFVVAVVAIFGLGITEDRQLHWAALVIMLTVLAGGAFLRGWLTGK